MAHCPAAHPEVQAESSAFLNDFNALPDQRQRDKVIYPLEEVLLLSPPARG